MGFLDKDRSWSLFSNVVFEEEGCPLELEEIGMKIVESCRGLPLSIVVVGGLLAKSKTTLEYWESIAGNLNSMVNSENDERCLKILYMSYNQLPVYLKPCFLYMGVFPEDRKIRVSELTKLWVSEGFLKPISGKSLEEVAYEYLHELINRNLVLVHKVGSIGKVKFCKIHDLLRDLCLRLAEKEKFYNVVEHFSRHVPIKERFDNIITPCCCPIIEYNNDVFSFLELRSPACSLICNSYSQDVILMRNFRLLRIMFFPFYYSTRGDVFNFVNARCVVLGYYLNSHVFFSSFYKLWNLQTLIAQYVVNANFIDIWNMPQLRHLKVNHFRLRELPSGDDSGQERIVLGNLQTLRSVLDFNCSEEMAKRVPNIRKLEVVYSSADCCANFGRLEKLETLYAQEWHDILRNFSFPKSLKKLTLDRRHTSYWEDTLEKVGSLPLLQKFKLNGGLFKGGKWETVEGQFPSLKFLSVKGYNNLKYWETENSHFPRLEHLVLVFLNQLKELPCEIGEIPTLKSIVLFYCSRSASISAKNITEKQVELFGEVVLKMDISLAAVTLPLSFWSMLFHRSFDTVQKTEFDTTGKGPRAWTNLQRQKMARTTKRREQTGGTGPHFRLLEALALELEGS